MNVNQSIIGKGTLSIKEVNQDFVAAANVPNKYNVIAVADGLGSFYNSEYASRFVCENLVNLIEDHDNMEELLFENLFEEITLNLKNKVAADFGSDDSHKNCFGTTLLCCIETEDEFQIGYLGNGGIFHIRGNFNSFPGRFYLPWNSINLLNPHSIEQSGKNAMYKLIEPNYKIGQIIPSVIKIRKDKLHFGDIIMLCSDGVYSYDEVQMGKDPNGKIWISGEEAMEKFYKHLNRYFSNKEFTNEALDVVINEYLEDLKMSDLIHDDTSLALVVSGKVQSFQLDKIAKAENGKNTQN
ncbi:protein phosphatase 2C domain-containing protein [Neolewinella agarilytica]|uniref:Serine/threonine protein phosphatase PrpC n=1 Tax=Neolewinella agarilytica TaxID=478744 RepID=A0A1H9JQC2_9BACT|nr:protein phosphatase 2C domain-containing protein [Neolewinella agarilytica]SEQ89017.1 Serine/threonine protein phosphatase PrpC [Neolewinella agarilytica]